MFAASVSEDGGGVGGWAVYRGDVSRGIAAAAASEIG